LIIQKIIITISITKLMTILAFKFANFIIFSFRYDELR